MGITLGASMIHRVGKTPGKRRERGSIERRGDSLRVKVYAGLDPITGRRIYLTGSTTDERQAEKIRTRLLEEVDAQRSARTRATLNAALDDWLRVHEVEETTMQGYLGYIERTIRPALGEEPVERITAKVLEELYAELRRCSQRCRNGEPSVDHRTAMPHECRAVRHRRRPGRPRAGEVHDCAAAGCAVVECPPHQCRPMKPSTIRQIHAILSSVLGAAVRWEWINSNPADTAKRPRQLAAKPDPPSTAAAARIVEASWRISLDWGMFVWLVFVTGMRRAEVIALRWSRIDLEAHTVRISQNWVELTGKGGKQKDTKSHQERTLALDQATVELLTQHGDRYEQDMKDLGIEVNEDAYVFSYSPLRDRPYSPSGVSHKYTRMCADLGIDSHLHALRHYSATELLTAESQPQRSARARSSVPLARCGHEPKGSTTDAARSSRASG